jgi:mRNA interferase RelE/StbE
LTFQIFIQRAAQKELAQISLPYRDKIIVAIRELSLNPTPPGAKKLIGRDGWRI